MPRATVIMRTKNSGWVIREALEALFSQTFQDFELSVVDSGSTDDTLAILEDYPHTLTRIAPESYYPGPVLNEAFARARTPLCILLNSDSVLLARNSLQNLVEAFDAPQVVAAYGRQLPRPEANPWVQRDYAESFPEGHSASWIGLSFPLAAMRHSAWRQRPFYDESWGSEDTEWGQWARREGLGVRYVPSAITMHSHNYSFRQLHGRRFIEGEADAPIYPERRANLLGSLRRALTDGARDIAACVEDAQPWRVPEAFARRLAGEWAYLRGNRHGQTRKSTGADAGAGQRVVLGSYQR